MPNRGSFCRTVVPHHHLPVRCHSTGARRGGARLEPVEDSQSADGEAGGGVRRGLHAPKTATIPEEEGWWRSPTVAAGEGRARKTFHSSAGRAGTGALAARHVRSCDEEAWWAGTREMTDVGVATGAATAEERAHCVFGRAIGVAIGAGSAAAEPLSSLYWPLGTHLHHLPLLDGGAASPWTQAAAGWGRHPRVLSGPTLTVQDDATPRTLQ